MYIDIRLKDIFIEKNLGNLINFIKLFLHDLKVKLSNISCIKKFHIKTHSSIFYTKQIYIFKNVCSIQCALLCTSSFSSCFISANLIIGFHQGKISCANVLSDLYAMGVTDTDNMLMLLGVSNKMSEKERDIVVPMMMRGFKVWLICTQGVHTFILYEV